MQIKQLKLEVESSKMFTSAKKTKRKSSRKKKTKSQTLDQVSMLLESQKSSGKMEEAEKLIKLQMAQIEQLQAEGNAYKQEFQAQIIKI